MIKERNASGKPLADEQWLENHHIAKLPERKAFIQNLLEKHPNPETVVDLGCATGLWMDLLNDSLPESCEIIGIDSDGDSLDIAKKRSETWSRTISFREMDLNTSSKDIPSADITLAFNIFSYIDDLDLLLDNLASRENKGILAVREYDGASIRFGPMSTNNRQRIERDLYISTGRSEFFKHYDMDRAFSSLRNCKYDNKEFGFELFERTTPFPKQFIPYYEEMIGWTCDHISERNSTYLHNWMSDESIYNRYFYEVDLVAILS